MTFPVEQPASDLLATSRPQKTEQELMEFRKLCAARFAWPIRNERTTNDPGITWADWFKAMFHKPLEAYRERLRQ